MSEKSKQKTPQKKTPQKKTPLVIVNDEFGGKAKLLSALEAFTTEELWIGRTNKDRGGKKGLARVSNAKLVRLHRVFTAVKEKFGTREKLVDSILDLEKRAKDADYKKKLLTHPVPRLYDQYKSAQKRAASASSTEKK